MSDEYIVNGLPLPPLLIDLLENEKWQHPGDDVIQKVIPFMNDPVNFLKTVQGMNGETNYILADDPTMSALFHELRGSKSSDPVELPWLDMEQAVVIAVNRVIGADVAIALDYRTDPNNPRVVASEWRFGELKHLWREVAATFSEFVELIGLK